MATTTTSNGNSSNNGFEPQSVPRGDEVVDLETRIRLRMEEHQAKLHAHRLKRQQNARWDDVDVDSAAALQQHPAQAQAKGRAKPARAKKSVDDSDSDPEADIARLTTEIARIDDELRHAAVLATPANNASGTSVSERQAETFVDSVFALREHESIKNKLSVSDLDGGGNGAGRGGNGQPSIADRGAEWLKKRDDKIAELTAKQHEKQDEAVKATPHINAKSRHMAAYHHQRHQNAEVSTRLCVSSFPFSSRDLRFAICVCPPRAHRRGVLWWGVLLVVGVRRVGARGLLTQWCACVRASAECWVGG